MRWTIAPAIFRAEDSGCPFRRIAATFSANVACPPPFRARETFASMCPAWSMPYAPGSTASPSSSSTCSSAPSGFRSLGTAAFAAFASRRARSSAP